MVGGTKTPGWSLVGDETDGEENSPFKAKNVAAGIVTMAVAKKYFSDRK